MGLIWEELGPKFKDLLEMGRSGVIASLIAASQRLHSHEYKVYSLFFLVFNFVLFPFLPPSHSIFWFIIPKLMYM